MRCPRCNAALEEGSVFCGNCGAQVTPVHGRDETVLTGSETLRRDEVSSNWPDAGSGRTSQGQTQRTALASFGQRTSSVPLPLTNKPMRNTSPLSAPRHWLMRYVLIVLVALVLIAGGTGVVLVLTHHIAGVSSATPTAAGVSPSGQVAFFDNPNSTAGNTDALSISVAHLSVLPAGSSYDAWLVNEQNEQITSLGKLTSNGAVFTLNFVSGENGTQAHLNLLGVGNKIEVTEEQGTVSVPGTHIILSADFPPRAFIHIRHLLFQFPVTPNNVGLLVGLLAQARLLNNQAVLAQNLVTGTDNRAGVQCFAQSMIDISEGTHGANYRSLSTWCKTHYTTQAGDGFGILGQNGYAATAAAHASLAASQPDATNTIRLHAQQVEIGAMNVKGWVTTIDQDALKLLANPNDSTPVAEIVSLSDHAFHGIPGSDGQVGSVTGEAGAITAYLDGQLMAGLTFH